MIFHWTYVPKKWYKWTYLKNRHRLTDLENELIVASGEGRREGIVRDFGINIFIPLYLKWVTNKDLLYSTGNSVQCYVAAQMEAGGLGENGYMYMYDWVPSLFTWNYHKVGNQLYPKTKYKIQKNVSTLTMQAFSLVKSPGWRFLPALCPQCLTHRWTHSLSEWTIDARYWWVSLLTENIS